MKLVKHIGIPQPQRLWLDTLFYRFFTVIYQVYITSIKVTNFMNFLIIMCTNGTTWNTKWAYDFDLECTYPGENYAICQKQYYTVGDYITHLLLLLLLFFFVFFSAQGISDTEGEEKNWLENVNAGMTIN